MSQTIAHSGTEAHAESAHHHHELSFFNKYIWSEDHKTIAIQYLFASLFFLLIGGLLAMGVRYQLAFSNAPIPLIGTLLPKWLVTDAGAIQPQGHDLERTAPQPEEDGCLDLQGCRCRESWPLDRDGFHQPLQVAACVFGPNAGDQMRHTRPEVGGRAGVLRTCGHRGRVAGQDRGVAGEHRGAAVGPCPTGVRVYHLCLDDRLPGQVPAPFRHHLVFKVNPRDPGGLKEPHRPLDVQRLADIREMIGCSLIGCQVREQLSRASGPEL